MELIYRLAEMTEMDEILSLQRLSLQILLRSSLSEELLEALIDHQARWRSPNEELILVAVCNGQILGFAACLFKQALITGLYVHPDFVRQGIGSSLLIGITNLFHKRQYRSINVYSSEYAIPFYQYHGFQTLHRSQMMVSRHQYVPTMQMRKVLRPVTPEEQQRDRIIWGILTVIFVVSLFVTLN